MLSGSMPKLKPQTESETCSVCQESNPKSRIYHCGLCEKVLCKNCTSFLDEDTFCFLREIPQNIKHTTYCGDCFDATVAPELTRYKDILSKAEDVYIFEKGKKNIPLIKKSRLKVSVTDCEDQKETYLRLAFFAAEQSYNSVIDVEIIYKKVRVNKYQKTYWSAVGYPALIRSHHLRDDIG